MKLNKHITKATLTKFLKKNAKTFFRGADECKCPISRYFQAQNKSAKDYKIRTGTVCTRFYKLNDVIEPVDKVIHRPWLTTFISDVDSCYTLRQFTGKDALKLLEPV